MFFGGRIYRWHTLEYDFIRNGITSLYVLGAHLGHRKWWTIFETSFNLIDACRETSGLEIGRLRYQGIKDDPADSVGELYTLDPYSI